MALHNRINKEILKQQLEEETFHRKTISFYRYFYMDNPLEFRNQIYREWDAINCFGRIYVAREGINAQMSVPEHNIDAFLAALQNHKIFENIPIKYAIEDSGKSFYKLTIKVRPKLVADGLDEGSFDVENVGTHLEAEDFHQYVGREDTTVIDMRNYYESEIGHFQDAICPKADTFKEELEIVTDLLDDNKDQKILLYCTGGIRCEKASAYLKHHGYRDVNQLHGGIIEYAQQIKSKGLESKFIGKNFVFDERLGERINDEIIAHCHQCGAVCDEHTNCANTGCHILFIQCPSCKEKYDGCCSTECKTEKDSGMRKEAAHGKHFNNSRKFRKSFSLIQEEKQNQSHG